MNRFLGGMIKGVPAIAFVPDALPEATRAALPEMLRRVRINHARECVIDRDEPLETLEFQVVRPVDR